MGDTQTNIGSETEPTDGTAPQQAGQHYRIERENWNDAHRQPAGVM